MNFLAIFVGSRQRSLARLSNLKISPHRQCKLLESLLNLKNTKLNIIRFNIDIELNFIRFDMFRVLFRLFVLGNYLFIMLEGKSKKIKLNSSLINESKNVVEILLKKPNVNLLFESFPSTNNRDGVMIVFCACNFRYHFLLAGFYGLTKLVLLSVKYFIVWVLEDCFAMVCQNYLILILHLHDRGFIKFVKWNEQMRARKFMTSQI